MRKFITDILAKTNLGVEQNAYVLGTVGIGTASPSYKLHVDGTIYGPTYTSGSITINSGDFLFSAEGGGDGFQMDYYNGQMYFGNNAGTSWHMVMQDNGNIGIGTTSPSAKLHVIGESKLTGSSAAYTFFDQINGTYYSVWYRNNNITYLYDSYLNSTPFVVNSSGNVGIGTTSPAAKLDVIGKGVFGTMASSRGAYSNGLSLQNNTGELTSLFLWQSGVASAHIGSPANNTSLYIVNSYNTGLITDPNSIVLTNTGNVGIGTTTPAYKLQVESSTNASVAVVGASGYQTALELKGADQWYRLISQPSVSGNRFDIYNQTLGAFAFSIASNSDAYLYGNVGIGTNGPTAPLTFGKAVYGDPSYEDFYRIKFQDVGGVNNDIGIGQPASGSLGFNVAAFGYISFNEGTNGERVRIAAGGNVGIGTTSPAYKLDVNGTGRFLDDLNLDTSSANTQRGLIFRDAGTVKWQVYKSIANDFRIYRQGSSNDALVIGTNDAVTFSSIVTASGNIRINSVPTTTSALTTISSDWANGSTIYTSIRIGAAADSLLAGVELRTYSNYAASSGTDFAIWNNSTSNVFTERMRITSGGNVGIGTTSPSYKLDVVGEARFGSNYKAIVGDDGAYGGYSTIGFGGTTNGYNRVFGATGTSDGLFLCAATGRDINFRPNGGTTDVFVIGANGYLYSNSYLFAYEDGSYNRFYRPNGTVGIYLGASDAGNYYDNTTHYFRNSGGGANYAIIDSNGNVGIGTTSPAQKLDVIGTIRSQVTSPGAGNGDVYAFAVHEYNGNNGRMGLGLHDTGDAFLGLYSDTGVTTRIDSNGSSYFMGGNVGIGTTSPGGKLDVVIAGGNVTTYDYGLDVKVSTGGGWARSYRLYNSNYTAGTTFWGTVGGGSSVTYSYWTIGDPASIDITGFNTSNGIFLIPSGNVGIGTTSLGSWAKLQVAGNLAITGSLFSFSDNLVGGQTPAYLDYNYSSGKLIVGSYGPSASGYIVLETGGTEKVRIANNGNVGIGTTAPSEILHVKSPGGNGGIWYPVFLGQNSTGYQNAFQARVRDEITDLGATILGANTGSELSFSNHPNGGGLTERMRITKTGNVGIGTTSPGSALDVRGVITGGNGTVQTVISYISGAGVVGTLTNHDLSIYANFAERMRITSAGNVGIGTTSPSELVDAYKSFNGDVVCQISNPNAGTSAAAQFFASNGTNRTQFFHTGTSYTGPGVLTSAAGLGGLYNATVQGLAFLAANASGTIKFATGTGNDERMRITSGGSLLIGDTTQGYSPTSQGYLLGVKSNTTQAFISIAKSGQTLDTNGMIVGLDSTAGYIYLRENIDLAFGTNNTTQVTIKNNGNVGIGTTSPSYKLDVRGSVGFFGDSSFQPGNLILTDVTSGGSSWGIYSGFPSLGDFTIRESGVANHLTIKKTSGNVGIGTTSPLSPLHQVGGGGNYTGEARFGGSSTAFGIELKYTQAGSTLGSIYTSPTYSSTDILFKLGAGSGNENQLVLKGNGNVGIGTTSPSDKLQVVASTYNGITITTPDVATFKMRSSSGATSWGFATTNLAANDFGIYQSNSGGGDPINAGTARLYFNGSGNVGIGTTSPAARLQVSGSAAVNTREVIADFRNSSDSQRIDIRDENGATSQPPGLYSATAGYGLGLYAAANSAPIILYAGGITNSEERMRILGTNGNVGIGTTSPSYKLDVYGGTDILKLQSTGTDARINIGHSANGGYIGYTNLGTTSNLFYVTTGSGTIGSGFVMDNAGNVGIGTTSPTAKLEVVGNINTRGLYFYDGGNNGTLRIDNSYGGGIDYHADQNGHRFFTWVSGVGWVQHFTITDAGNVGIGTTNPTQQLETTARFVIGNAVTGRVGIFGQATATADTYITIQNTIGNFDIGTSSGGHYFYGIGSLPLQFYTNSTEKMRITSGGNVGIGTTSPVSLLNLASTFPQLTLTRTDNASNPAAAINFASTSTVRWQIATNSAVGTGFEINQADGSTNRFYINTSGNVGIGTASPAGKLHVYSTTSSDSIGHIQYENGSTGTGSATNAQLIGKSKYGTLQYMVWESSGARIGMRSTSNGGSGNLYFTTGTDSVTLTMLATGNVGIGTTGPSYKLHVEGNTSGISIYASHDIAAFSDITVKKEVKRIENAVDKVKELNGYTYVRTDDETGTRRAGVIAQEVQKVLPEVVSQNPDGTLNVAYANMIALLIEGMKEQQATIERMQQEINELKK